MENLITGLLKQTTCKHINLFTVDYKDTKDRMRSWDIVSRRDVPRCISKNIADPDAVVIVPVFTTANEIILIKEYRTSLGRYQYGFPAGLVDAGETVMDAAKRELKEETGLDVIRCIATTPPLCSSAGMTDEMTTVVFVSCGGVLTTKNNEATEDIDTVVLKQTEVKKFLDSCPVIDAKAWFILTLFANSGIAIFK